MSPWPVWGGIETTKRLLDGDASVAVIMLIMQYAAGYVREADAAGARGYLLKSSAPELIQQAIAVVSAAGPSTIRPSPVPCSKALGATTPNHPCNP
jgi:DNA-binding NarL/FixJ family response regulator